MNDERNEKRRQWFEKHPELQPNYSMKRRKAGHDYRSRCIYMVTLVVEGRRPLLGELCAPDDKHPQAWLRPSELGKRVLKCWRDIGLYNPQIRLMAVQLMPDHLHGVLFVTERMPRHLGQVINGFKREELPSIINQAVIGNVVRDFSKTGSPNGSSSVIKIYETMEAGVPVILSKVPLYEKMVEKYHCGIYWPQRLF